MNFLQKVKASLGFYRYIGNRQNKLLSGEQWKKGLMIGANMNDKGTTRPYKDSSLVYVAVKKIAENIGQAPLKFFQSESELPAAHPIVRLFRRPNENMDYYTFLEVSTTYLALYGEVFWYLNESVGQRLGSNPIPAEIIPINPTRMQHVLDNKTNKLKGWIYRGKPDLSFSKDEVLHIKFPNPYLEIRGLSPLDTISSDIDADYLAGRYGKMFFVNSASPRILFTTHEDDESTQEQKEAFLAEWNQLYKGVSKSGKSAILNAGMDVQKIGLTQEEMQWVDARKFNNERILSAFGVPPAVAGFYEEATYGNVRTAKKIFWNETIKVYTRRYENIINIFLIDAFEPDILCMFDFSEVDELKHDQKELADTIHIYANHGIPMNDLIRSFNLPFDPVEGLDVGYQPISMVEVGTDQSLYDTSEAKMIDITPKEVKQIEDLTKTKDIQKTMRNSFLNKRSKLEALFSKELKNYFFQQRVKLLNGLFGKKEIDTMEYMRILAALDIWADEDLRLETKFLPVYEEVVDEAGNLARSYLGLETPYVVDMSIVRERIKVLRGINEFSQRLVQTQVKQALENGETLNQVGDRIKNIYNKFNKLQPGITKTRVQAISRTECGSMMNQVALDEYSKEGVKEKQWLGGSRKTHAAVSGTIVPIHATFVVGNYEMEHPGDPNAGPEEVVNCTCSIIPIVR